MEEYCYRYCWAFVSTWCNKVLPSFTKFYHLKLCLCGFIRLRLIDDPTIFIMDHCKLSIIVFWSHFKVWPWTDKLGWTIYIVSWCFMDQVLISKRNRVAASCLSFILLATHINRVEHFIRYYCLYLLEKLKNLAPYDHCTHRSSKKIEFTLNFNENHMNSESD